MSNTITPLEIDLYNAQHFLESDAARFKFAFVEANNQILVDACHQIQKSVTPHALGGVYDRCKSTLAESRSYTEAYRELFSRHPEIADIDANRFILDKAFCSGGFQGENAVEDLEAILPGVRERVCESPEFLQEQSEIAERERIISELITTLIDPKTGKPRISLARDNLSPQAAFQKESARIRSLGLDELRRIRDERTERQRLRGMSVEDLKAEVRQGDAARQAPTHSLHRSRSFSFHRARDRNVESRGPRRF